MSTGCEFHADALADLAAGRLDPARDAGLRAHLADCAGCREELEVVTAVAAAEVVPPSGLEARIRTAVREAAAAAPAPHRAPAGAPRETPGWRAWALPLAAAAAVAAIWLGTEAIPGGQEPGTAPGEAVTLASEGWAPYGTWPAGGSEVAGEPVLSELSAEDLELLLEAMEP